MPRLTDLAIVRARLDRDRAWAAYAIGDLAPGFVEHCRWHAPAGDPAALLLLYSGFTPPILFAMGTRDAVRAVVEEIPAPDVSLHLQPEGVEALSGIYVPQELRPMLRMALAPGAFRPAAQDDVRPLSEDDLDAIAELYADGYRHGEGPGFFSGSMLQQGTFRGVWEGDALVSVAGTHLYSADLGVCAVGNVYTRRDRRGRGLGARVTSAVVAHAIAQQVPTIVLNVSQDNVAAQRVYARLGFERYCTFFEGEATRTRGSALSTYTDEERRTSGDSPRDRADSATSRQNLPRSGDSPPVMAESATVSRQLLL